MPNTAQEYDSVIDTCRDIFVKKMHDYGTAWRILRPTSITDQIFIKANRIRCIEEKGITKVNEGIIPEFIGIINYSIMGLIQLELGTAGESEESDHEQIAGLYDTYFQR
ncbi:MAG: DUF1599 domain-containing protein, partial [Odoribacter splanchnicus]|nr:DUF1599 domain-containing protein [Odoribacter splanchnicus]